METIKNQLIQKSKKNIFSIVFEIIWIYIFCLKVEQINAQFTNDLKSAAFAVVLYFFTLYFVYQLIWAILGEKVYEVVDNKLIIVSNVFFISIKKIYDIEQISNVTICNYSDKSTFKTYNGFMGFRFYDDEETNAISFVYYKKEKIIGNDLSESNLDVVKSWIS